MTAADFGNWIEYSTLALTAVLLARLLKLSGPRKYVYFVAYYLTDLAATAGGLESPTDSLRYGYFYFGGQAVKAVLGIGVAIQLWLLALRDYPALARFGRRVAVYMLLGALLLAAAGLLLEPPLSPDQSLFTHYFNAIEGTIDSMTVLFLAAAALFLLWFPVETPRNTAYLMGGFVFCLTQHWVLLLVLNHYPLRSLLVSSVILSLDFSCLLFWLAALKLPGETATTVTGHRWNPDEAERLVAQLQAINRRLELASRS